VSPGAEQNKIRHTLFKNKLNKSQFTEAWQYRQRHKKLTNNVANFQTVGISIMIIT